MPDEIAPKYSFQSVLRRKVTRVHADPGWNENKAVETIRWRVKRAKGGVLGGNVPERRVFNAAGVSMPPCPMSVFLSIF